MRDIDLLDAWNAVTPVLQQEEAMILKKKILKQQIVEDALLERLLSLDKTVATHILGIQAMSNSEEESREQITKLTDEIRVLNDEIDSLKARPVSWVDPVKDKDKAMEILKGLGYIVYKARPKVTKPYTTAFTTGQRKRSK